MNFIERLIAGVIIKNILRRLGTMREMLAGHKFNITALLGILVMGYRYYIGELDYRGRNLPGNHSRSVCWSTQRFSVMAIFAKFAWNRSTN